MKISGRHWTVAAGILFVVLGSESALANNKFLNIQGKLTDTSGNPLTGNQTVTFRLYTSSSGGSAAWTESQTVALSTGLFNVALGTVTAMDSISFNQLYYLSIQVAGDASELSPRQQLGASAYAQGSLGNFNVGDNLVASSSVTAGGSVSIGGQGVIAGSMTVSGNAFSVGGTTLAVTNGKIGIGTSSPADKLQIVSSVSGSAHTIASLYQSSESRFQFELTSGDDALLRLRDDTETDKVVLQAAGITYLNGGNVGIGTENPAQKLQVAGRILATGSGYVTDPTGPLFGQYASYLGYVQAPASGQIEIWDDGSNTLASFQDNGNVIFPSKVGIASATPTFPLTVTGNAYFTADVSALTFTDRTPYPETTKQAYEAVLSMRRNARGGVDHTALDPFIRAKPYKKYDEAKVKKKRPQNGENIRESVVGNNMASFKLIPTEGRDLSATVSAQNEVIKDLIRRIAALEAK